MNLSEASINASVLAIHSDGNASSTSGKVSIDITNPKRCPPKNIAMLIGHHSASTSPVNHEKRESLDAFLARQPALYNAQNHVVAKPDTSANKTKLTAHALMEDDEDATEYTMTETDFSSDSLHGSSWHSQRSSCSPLPRTPKGKVIRPPLRVASHQYPATPLLEDEEDEDDAAESNPISFSNLEYHRTLGEGFFGQVWLVSTPPSLNKKTKETCSESTDVEEKQYKTPSSVSATAGKYYALKKLSKYHLLCEDQVENTIREKQLLQTQLHHPGIVHLVAAHQDTSFLYLLLDYHPGGELFNLIHNNIPNFQLTELHAQFYTACLADALWYMHCRCSVVYRDLKPENVVIDRLGYPVLVDFGYAKPLSANEFSYTMCGTPKYLAPEIIAGAGYGRTVDYWALGILAYEMLTHGEHPFEFWSGMDDGSLYGSIAEAEYLELPPKLSEQSRQFVHGLIGSKQPEHRLGYEESETSNSVLEHAWLSPVDIPALRRRLIAAPWVPSPVVQLRVDEEESSSPADFDDDHHLLMTADGDTLLTQREQRKFADF